MPQSYEERVALNEDTFRKVNRAIEAGRHGDGPESPIAFICECGTLGCPRVIELPLEHYRAIRADSRRFFVVPGHERPDVERVVERHADHNVVEKVDRAGEVAEAADGR